MKLFPLLLLALAPSWTSFAQAPRTAPAAAAREPIFAGKESWMSDHEWLALFDPPFTRPWEVPMDGRLRKTLFDQFRAKVRQEKGGVRFKGILRAFKNWALFRGEALDARGNPIYISYSPKVKVKDDPLANADVAGLWLRTRAGWKLVDYGDIGCGEFDDPTSIYWADRYGMPVEFWGKDAAAPVVQRDRKTAFAFPKRVDIRDSALRKNLFDLLRPEAERLHGKGPRFTGSLVGFKNWALFEGQTIDEKGRDIPHDGGDTAALWLRTRNGWLLVDFDIGHTDAFYTTWKEKYGAPFF